VARYSVRDIAQLRIAVAEGLTGNECATMLQRSPLSIRAKCCALGLRLRREQGEHELRFQLTKRTHAALREISKKRGTSPSRFIRLLVEVCVRDGLLESIADRTASLQAILTENARTRPAPKRATVDKFSSSSLLNPRIA
jgi:hypothetical protein